MAKNQTKPNNLEPPKSSVSLTAVFVFLFIILAIFVSFLFYLRFSNISPLADFFHRNSANLGQNLENYFKTETTIQSGPTVSMKITEAQISEAIGVDKSGFPLKSPSLSVRPEGVILTGKTSNYFWGIGIEAILTPKIVLGELQFDIKSIKAAGVQAPPQIADSLSPKLNDLFANLLPTDSGVTLSDVHPMVGYLLLEGKKQ